MTIWQVLVGIYLFLMALVGFGVNLPGMLVAIVALLAAIAVLAGK